MERNSKLKSLVLHIKPLGENNRLVTFLSEEKGIFTAVLYGGAKSKLRSLVSPGHFGNLWIYNDSAKNSIKITDFEVLKYHTELRENLYKNWCFNFASELVIKTEGSGDAEKAFVLVNAFLDGICISEEAECRIALLRFIWRYLGILGLQYESKFCSFCENEIKSFATFSLSDNGFICNECKNDNSENIANGIFFLNSECMSFLQGVTYLPPAKSRNIPLHYCSSQNLHDFLFYLIKNSVEKKLISLDMEVKTD